MSKKNKDELIEAQKEVIGILFEIIKRLQANNDLDDEYFRIISAKKISNRNKQRLEKIKNERTENSKIIQKLLEKLEI